MLAIPNVGPRTAREIQEWFEEPDNVRQVEEMLNLGVRPLEGDAPVGDTLAGKSLVLTGRLESFDAGGRGGGGSPVGRQDSGQWSKATSLRRGGTGGPGPS